MKYLKLINENNDFVFFNIDNIKGIEITKNGINCITDISGIMSSYERVILETNSLSMYRMLKLSGFNHIRFILFKCFGAIFFFR